LFRFCLHCNVSAFSKHGCSLIDFLCGLFEKSPFHRENPHNLIKNPHIDENEDENENNDVDEIEIEIVDVFRIIFVNLPRTYINDLYIMKNFKNYCSVFASIIAFSNSVFAQDLELEEPAPAPASESVAAPAAAPATTPVTTPVGTSSVVNIFPIQGSQAPVAQQPVYVPVPTPAPAPAPEPAPAPVIIEEVAAPEPPHPHRHVTVGFRGMLGVSRFSERTKEDGHNVDYHTHIDILQNSANEIFLPYLEGGLVIDIPIYHYLAVSTGIFYSQKANHRQCFIDSTNFKSEDAVITRIGYLKIPGQFVLRNRLREDHRFDIAAGPYMAFGLHGKVKERYVSDVDDMILQQTENKIDVFDESIFDNINQARVAPYKRFDFGFCFTTTYEFHRYCIGANFDMGLTDITKPEHNIGNTRTRSIGVFFGYMFR